MILRSVREETQKSAKHPENSAAEASLKRLKAEAGSAYLFPLLVRTVKLCSYDAIRSFAVTFQSRSRAYTGEGSSQLHVVS